MCGPGKWLLREGAAWGGGEPEPLRVSQRARGQGAKVAGTQRARRGERFLSAGATKRLDRRHRFSLDLGHYLLEVSALKLLLLPLGDHQSLPRPGHGPQDESATLLCMERERMALREERAERCKRRAALLCLRLCPLGSGRVCVVLACNSLVKANFVYLLMYWLTKFGHTTTVAVLTPYS